MEVDTIWQEVLADFRKGNKLEALVSAQQAYEQTTDAVFKWRLGFIIITILIDLNKHIDAKNVLDSLSSIESALPEDFQKSDEFSGRLMQIETMFINIVHDADITEQLTEYVKSFETIDVSIYHAPARINLVVILYKLKEYELMDRVMQNMYENPVLGGPFTITFVKAVRAIMQDKPADKLVETLVHTADTPFARWALYQRLKIILDEKHINIPAILPSSEANSIIK